MPKPIVALVGRPNVGKSTLFNRIVGRRLAVVHDRPGTTRDRIHAPAEWNDIAFTVVDTGGIEVLPDSVTSGRRPGPERVLAQDSAPFIPLMRAQAEQSIREADAIIFLTDAASGLTPADEEVADILRRARCPIFLVANKADNASLRQDALEFYALGMKGEVYSISALHGDGVADLLDDLVQALPSSAPEIENEAGQDWGVKLAIVGRPNVGKSSLLNKLLGEERAIVSPIAGTTRDAIDTHLEWEGVPITLIDTAGIRRRGKIERGVEHYSVLRALRAIQRADVALLVIDGIDGVTAQDTHVAGFILDEWASVVVLINKWDAVEKDTYTMIEYTQWVRQALKFLDYVPVLFISALTGKRVRKVAPLALAVQAARFRRIATGELNRLVQGALARHAPPSKRGKRLKIYYASQPGVDPPTFVFHVNDPDLVHFSYERYLENQLRNAFEFPGTPLRLIFRARAQR
ncbi:MAG: ribosome biogenesis GTPase Der [Chloroflexi bacterium]|nr:MAG: ribosome biogenesis GTPase Der [Anaerolineaceae bacterium 4572_32.2]RLC79415.1 MAG: ribosome biogenesis GTPase Der [Chloroflexota bacterium]RLC85951.1 MAG: ribosome biogenesis GTPase Der [Chloroflexota bacterium]HEY72371.1 ribosome biogenesis GTPase Der [Thermoflexia bacterium]